MGSLSCCKILWMYNFMFVCIVSFVWADDANGEPKLSKTMNILMKGAKPTWEDAYLCASYPVEDDEIFIYKFEAMANASTAHHMLLYGCDGPSHDFVIHPHVDFWSCPPMCVGKRTIMFAWAKNAAPTVLPTGVGLRIGKTTTIKTIVLQVHYAKSFSASGKPDRSGLKLYLTHTQPKFVAGIYLLLASRFHVPPRQSSYPVDMSCKFSEKKSIFPFAFRTHSHGLGKVITGYQWNGSYHEIGKGNPQWPQAFYAANKNIEIKPGEYVAARCTYDSSGMDDSVQVGATGHDEMCNFYIMFYTDSSVRNLDFNCYDNNDPDLTGNNFPPDVSVPLPHNATLEEEAKGHHHHHGGMPKAHQAETPETPPTRTPTAHQTTLGHPQRINIKEKLTFNSSWPEQSLNIGQVGGVATDKVGNLYIFHRATRVWERGSFDVNDRFMYPEAPIMEDVIVVLDPSGKLIRKFGRGMFFMPHGIHVDEHNNIWLTDVALHQVFKIPFNDMKPSLTLGKRFSPGSGLSYFCKPTDVAVLSSGEFYVTDGYCNGRVMKFSPEGKLVKTWGKRKLFQDEDPRENVFNVPHSITLSEKDKVLCVADRENGRIQCFDLEGRFKHIIQHEQFGARVFAVDYCPEHGGLLYAVNGPQFDWKKPPSVQGFTMDMKNGDLIETWNVPQNLKNPHDVCVDPKTHSVYVGELNPRMVWKLTRVDDKGAEKMKADAREHHDDDHHDDHNPEVIKNVKKEGTSAPHHLSPSATTASPSHTASFNESKENKPIVQKEKIPDADPQKVTVSIVVGCLLIIPVITVLVVALICRGHRSGKLKWFGNGVDKNRHKQVFNFQRLLGNSHKGFDPLSTEESDHDIDVEDSDHDEYTAPRKNKT